MSDKKRRFNVGEIVKVKGYGKKLFEIVSWFYEASFDDGKFHEHVCYSLKSKSGEIISLILPEEIIEVQQTLSNDKVSPAPSRNKISVAKHNPKQEDSNKKERIEFSKQEIDELLDAYNDYIVMDKFFDHIGLNDNEYKIKAEEIISLLKSGV